MIEHTERILESEIETWDTYLRGDVYGFVAEDPEGEQIDSCWGFYGDEGIKSATEEAQSHIDYHIDQARKEHENKLKAQIKAHTPLEKREPVEA